MRVASAPGCRSPNSNGYGVGSSRSRSTRCRYRNYHHGIAGSEVHCSYRAFTGFEQKDGSDDLRPVFPEECAQVPSAIISSFGAIGAALRRLPQPPNPRRQLELIVVDDAAQRADQLVALGVGQLEPGL